MAPALCEQSAKQAMTNIDIMTDDNWLFWSLKLWGSLEAVNGGHPARVHKVQQRANDGDVRELRTKRVSHGFTNHCMVLKQIPLSSYPLCDIETYWRSLRGCGSMMFFACGSTGIQRVVTWPQNQHNMKSELRIGATWRNIHTCEVMKDGLFSWMQSLITSW